MAAAGGRLLAAAAAYSGRAGWGGPRRSPAVPLVPSRSATVTRSGAILPKPVKVSEGRAGESGSQSRRNRWQRWPIVGAGAAAAGGAVGLSDRC